MKNLEDRLVRIVAAAFVIYSVVLTSLSVVLLVIPRGETLTIQHTPVEQTIVGSRVEIQATVKGGAGDHNVTLYYRIRPSDHWRLSQMQLAARGGNTYVYLIPSTETTGSMDYQICAKDGSSVKICTQTYTILVGDFYFIAYVTPIFYPNRTSSMDIEIQSVDRFNRTIDLSLSGLPTQKVTATFEPSHVAPPPSQRAKVKLHFAIQDYAPAGKYDLTVSGTSGSVKRSFVMTLSIPDFELVVTPSNQTLKPSDRATFTTTLRSTYGFDSDVKVYVKGLPKGASYQLTPNELHLDGIAILVLMIETTSSVERGTYDITVSAIGGGRQNSFTITLVIV